MPLKACPVCGYALSILDPHCRHCLGTVAGDQFRLFGPRHLTQILIALGLIGLIVSLIAFR